MWHFLHRTEFGAETLAERTKIWSGEHWIGLHPRGAERMCGNAGVAAVAGVFPLILGLGCSIVAVATTHWFEGTVQLYKTFSGAWLRSLHCTHVRVFICCAAMDLGKGEGVAPRSDARDNGNFFRDGYLFSGFEWGGRRACGFLDPQIPHVDVQRQLAGYCCSYK